MICPLDSSISAFLPEERVSQFKETLQLLPKEKAQNVQWGTSGPKNLNTLSQLLGLSGIPTRCL